MSKAITTVPKLPKLERKKRVAAYARVSGGKDAMLHSLSAQVSHYSDFIQNHGDWIYAGVYADAAVIIGLKTLRLKKCQKHGAFLSLFT